MSKLVIPGVIASAGGSGGGGGTVDQTYDPTSTNAQSGTAVAEAVQPALKNTATGTNSISIGPTTGSTGSQCISIGKEATTSTYSNAIAVGNTASAQNSATVAIGSQARAWGVNSISIGSYTFAYSTEAIAIGTGNMGCFANANKAIQLGEGSNTTANSFQVYSYQMLDGTTGKIPVERLPSGNSIEVTNTMPTPSSSNVGKVKLYSGTTTSNFTNGYLYQCKLESTLEETVTFDSDKISAPAEMFWFIVKFVLPETYSSVTNGNITYTESANLVTFTFKDADNTVLGQFPGDVGELSAAGFTFNNLTDGDVINFTCFSGMVESYEWEPLIVQESSEIKIYNAPSWSQNTTLFPNCRLSLPNIDDLTEPGIFRVKYTENDENGSFNLDYLCNVSQFTTNGTIVGIFQSLQVIYPSVGNDSGINATLYRTKLSGGTWSNWKSSLVTSVSSNSIYSEYVSAKLFYDTCGNIEALINAL